MGFNNYIIKFYIEKERIAKAKEGKGKRKQQQRKAKQAAKRTSELIYSPKNGLHFSLMSPLFPFSIDTHRH